jgi:hypothetical protein
MTFITSIKIPSCAAKAAKVGLVEHMGLVGNMLKMALALEAGAPGALEPRLKPVWEPSKLTPTLVAFWVLV